MIKVVFSLCFCSYFVVRPSRPKYNAQKSIPCLLFCLLVGFCFVVLKLDLNNRLRFNGYHGWNE